MRLLRTPAFIRYLIGFACLLLGAAASEAFDSMLPLAMGSAVVVMCTISLVREIRATAERRRAKPHRR